MEIELDFVLNQIGLKFFLKMVEIESFKNSKQAVSRVSSTKKKRKRKS
jgi:hypothetical protein